MQDELTVLDFAVVQQGVGVALCRAAERAATLGLLDEHPDLYEKLNHSTAPLPVLLGIQKASSKRGQCQPGSWDLRVGYALIACTTAEAPGGTARP